MDADPGHERHLKRLRAWRCPRRPDLSLGYLADYVDKRIARPHKQLGRLIELWRQSVPEDLQQRTALAGFNRGVLTVHTADSATQYELDRLLRGGLERRLKHASQRPLRKVRLKVAPLSAGGQ